MSREKTVDPLQKSKEIDKIVRLMIREKSIQWDIIRAYKESHLTQDELRMVLLENNINTKAKTIFRYKEIYDRLLRDGYRIDEIETQSPSYWVRYYQLMHREKLAKQKASNEQKIDS